MSAGYELPATVIVGNQRGGSRTATAAIATARAVQRHAGAVDTDLTVIELADLASVLFDWGNAEVTAAKDAVVQGSLLVVASPVYKASFTGLLKAFLDQFARDELAALATVPLMVGASLAHSLAVEQQLRPVLVEIGASCPTRGLYIVEDGLNAVDEQLAAWLSVWGDALVGVARSRTSGHGVSR
ncbi:MAG: NAD(P)H-dependent oxidoreductase [Ilumatobacteraceae bacterium]